MITCLQVPHFAALTAAQDDPGLGASPFVLLAEDGTVYAASPHAHAAGVRVGMKTSEARTLCDELTASPTDPLAERRALDALLETLSAFSDRVEAESRPAHPSKKRRLPAPSIDDNHAATITLDLGKIRGSEGREISRTMLGAVAQHLGLRARVGLASNRFTARLMAASLDAEEVGLVGKGREAEFVAPYPSTVLPIYPEQARRLALLGLDTLGALAALPASALGDLFGGQGRAFHRLAQGRDPTPVARYVPPRIESTSRQLEPPVGDRRIIVRLIDALSETLTERLLREGLAAREVELAVSLAGGRRRGAVIALRQATSSSPKIARTAHDLLDTLKLAHAVEAVELTLRGIGAAEARQLSLFPVEAAPGVRLRAALRALAAKHGEDTFWRVEVHDPAHRLPERRVTLQRLDDG